MCPAGWIFFFYFRAIGSGRTGEPGEDVVVVGSMAYGSATSSFQWYSWLDGTRLARWRRWTRQSDKKVYGLAQRGCWLVARPRDPAAACTSQFIAS